MKKTYKCANCGNPTRRYDVKVENNIYGVFCCRECFNEYREKHNIKLGPGNTGLESILMRRIKKERPDFKGELPWMKKSNKQEK